MKIIALLPIVVALSGCVGIGPPAAVVSGFNESSVEIEQDNYWGNANPQDPSVISEANRICATAGRRAEYASTRTRPVGQYGAVATHLFLCLRR